MRNINTKLRCVPFTLLCLLLSALTLHGQVFSQPAPEKGQINVTYGSRDPLVPVTGTISGVGTGCTANTTGCPGNWEIVALDPYYVPPHGGEFQVVPMPAWISFSPESVPISSSGGLVTIKMTIDPTKGTGGTVLLGIASAACSSICSLGFPSLYDQNGVKYGYFSPNTGTPASGGGTGTFYVTTGPFPSTQNSSSLDLGPNFPRSGCEGMCGQPINLTNGNTWVRNDEYELPGLGGGISLKRTWNSQWSSSSPFIEAGMFGDSWQSSYEKRIQVLASGTEIRYWRGDGSAWYFTGSNKSGWTFISPVDERATLVYSSKTGYTITFRDGSQENYSGTTGFLMALLDRNGNKATLTYDGSNRLTTVTDAAARVLQFNYDPIMTKQVKTIQDSVGTIATYTYDSGSHLLSATYADNSVLNYSYDSSGLLLSVTDQLSKVLEAHTYDSQGRGLSSQRANGVDSLTVSYSWEGSFATLTDSLSHLSTYDGGVQIGNRRYVTNIQGTGCDSCAGRNNQTFTYDTSGNRVTSLDPNGTQTSYAYDATGNMTQKTTGSQIWKYTWNSFGEPLTVTDPLNNVTTYTYDGKGNLLTVQTPNLETTTYGYDTKGELTSIKDPRLNVSTITYNAVGLIASIKDAQNDLTQFAYDPRGNKTSVTDPLTQVTSYSYDARNRLTKITYPTSPATTTQFGYDYRGRRISVTDANSKLTQYGYDDADRLVSVTDANNNVTGYGYDTENNLTQVTDAATNATSFTYDPLGRATLTTFPVGTESYAYDSNGNLTSKTDRNNNTIQYGYDTFNRLTSKTYPDTTSVSYTYDLANHLMQVSDSTGTYGFTYDTDGRLTQASTTYSFIPGHVFNVGYGYDAASNRTSMTDPQNTGTTYVYDTLNRLSSLTSPQGAFGFGYDALSRRTQLTRPNGVGTTYGYNSVSRLLSVLHKVGNIVLDGTSYTIDGEGNRSSQTNQASAVTSNFTYDPVYQLTQVVQGVSTTESYSYDALGNRLSSLGASPYVYNSSNELTSDPSASFTYDSNGNPLTKTDATGTTNYTWDFENRLVSVALPGTGGTVIFKYDPLGRRIQKSSSSGTTTNYVYEGANLLEEVDSTGNVLARYSDGLGIDEPLAILRNGTTSFYEADGLGSITSLSNSVGAVAATYTYDSFGKVTASTGTVTNPLQYTAREFDSETNLNYYRARYYDPGVGRFSNEDPLSFHGGINRYRYASNNPVNRIDPLGLSDINVLVIPVTTTALTTQGVLVVQVNGVTEFQGYSLEPSGTNPDGGSLLPPGVYPAKLYNSPGEGYVDLLLSDTTPMRYVEIHKGNKWQNSLGCILPGTSETPDHVWNSGRAFDQIMRIVGQTYISDGMTGQRTTVTVTQF